MHRYPVSIFGVLPRSLYILYFFKARIVECLLPKFRQYFLDTAQMRLSIQGCSI